MSDGRIDGKFTIREGSCFSKALAEELDLQKTEKLGSVWNEIISMAEEELNGRDLNKVYANEEFELSSSLMDKILEKVNGVIKRETPIVLAEENPTSDGTETEEIVEDEVVDPEDGVDEEVLDDIPIEEEFTEDKLPSVLLRNTGIISAAMLLKAIKDVNYRQSLLPSLKNLTKEQQKAFNEACKKYDDAIANRAKIQNNIKSGKKAKGTANARSGVVQSYEQGIADAKTKVEKAKAKVNAETNALSKNTKYQQTKTEIANIDKEIKALEAQKAKNKSGKLSPKNEARLKALNEQKTKLLTEKQKFETKLNNAKAEQKAAARELKAAQNGKALKAAEKKVKDTKTKADAELKALRENAEYKQARSDLTQVNKKIKALEAKNNLTKAETKELTKLKQQQVGIKSKISKLSKKYTEAKLNYNTAKSELTTIGKAAKNPTKAAETATNAAKNAGKKVKINMKKLPKAHADVVKAFASKAKVATSAGKGALRAVGKVAKPVMAVVSLVDIHNAYKTGGVQKAARQTIKLGAAGGGAWAGGAVGAKIGATIGAIGGPAGVAAGAVIGGLIGGIAGWWAGEKVYDKAESVAMPDVEPLGQETVPIDEEFVELDFETEEELQQFLEENPEYADAIEIEDESPELIEV